MSAIFMDGFDHYGTGTISSSNMQAGPYASMRAACGAPSWGPSRTGTSCLAYSASETNATFNRKVLPTPGSHFFFSMGFAVDNLTVGDNQIINWYDGSLNSLYYLMYTSTGVLQLVKGSTGIAVASTAGPVLVTQNWHFLEMEINLTAGTFSLRVDDAQATNTPILSASGLTAGTIAQFGLISGNAGSVGSPTAYIDDLFIRDSAGTINNGWLGDRRVATLFANGDTTTAGWTPEYYKHFGTGICTFSFIKAGSSTPQNTACSVATPGATALDMGAADFTLETWVRFDALPGGSDYSTLFSRWNAEAGSSARSFRFVLGSTAYNGGCLQFDTSTDGTGSTVATKIQYPWTPVTNVWYHIALVRAAGQLLLFVNGKQFGLPITDGDTYFQGTGSVLSVGTYYPKSLGFAGTSGTQLIGRMDETRYTNGVGRYTANFTPPTAIFPRGVSDPNWSSVVWLMGYDAGIADESSYARFTIGENGAVSFSPADGSAIGEFTTVNKAIPDDNTFIQASLINANNVFTLTSQPSNATTVTVGTKNGTTAAVYTFKTTLASAFDVLIDTTAQNTLNNLMNAINAGTGIGTKYGTGTTSNFDVNAVPLPAGQIQVFANTAGSAGNSISSTSTSTGAWDTTTLTGGLNIPGPSAFKVQRPPNNTTVISAMQMNVRALKTDAGTANIQSTFVGPLGGTAVGNAHALTVSGVFYPDIVESDPDTSGPITPTTVINGKLSINRTA